MADKEATEFITTVLQWDYGAMFEKYNAGKGVADTLDPVPRTFSSVQDYRATFETMLMEEALAQIMAGSESAELITPQPAVMMSASKAGSFLVCNFILAEEHAMKFSHKDLVVVDLTNPMDEENEHAFKDHAIGHVDAREASTLRIKFFLAEQGQAGNSEGAARVVRVRKLLVKPMTGWWLMRLSNVATISREWAAVQRVELSSFQDVLLTAQPRAAPPKLHLEVPPLLLAHLKTIYNDSQMSALTAGLDGRPIVLIQGPPGTGKTQTIMGLLSVLKNSAWKGSTVQMGAGASSGGAAVHAVQAQLHLWRLSSPWLFAPPGRTCLRHTYGPSTIPRGNNVNCFGMKPTQMPINLSKQQARKMRVLVCAPSNAALDEIVLRVIRDGLLDGKARGSTPNIVRAGVTARMHPLVSAVALNQLVDKYIEAHAQDFVEKDGAANIILNGADIVFSTLSFAGGALFQRLTVPFDTVVIDEAAQALEPSSLVPLLGSVKQVYMVGDPVQLPATVISTRAVAANYQQSLFKRLQDSGYPVHVLKVQYRMNPAISSFASQTFYKSAIEDDPDMAKKTAALYHDAPVLGPLAFLHVDGQEDVPEGSASICNQGESEMVLALLQCFASKEPALGSGPNMGVITPYKSQMLLIKKLIKGSLPDLAPHVDVNTIDGFQGREKDVIIFSTVRTRVKHKRSIGFVADERRINVGLTRARKSLIVVGHRHALKRDTNWSSLLRTVAARGALYDAKQAYLTFLKACIEGKIQPVKLKGEEKKKSSGAFFAAAEDDVPTIVPRKRSAAAPSGSSKQQKTF